MTNPPLQRVWLAVFIASSLSAMSNAKHDQFVGCRIDHEVNEIAVARHHELADVARPLPPAVLWETCSDFKRPQDRRADPHRSTWIALEEVVGNRVDVSLSRRQIPDR